MIIDKIITIILTINNWFLKIFKVELRGSNEVFKKT